MEHYTKKDLTKKFLEAEEKSDYPAMAYFLTRIAEFEKAEGQKDEADFHLKQAQVFATLDNSTAIHLLREEMTRLFIDR